MQVTPNYHFNGNCQKALKLYEEAFQAKMTMMMYYKDADPSDFSLEGLPEKAKNYVYHAEMMIGNQRFMFSDEFEEIQKGQNISMVVTFDSPEEVKNAYNILADGASIIYPIQETTYSSCFASLIDRFGMRWELMTENKVIE